jgi:hypothetical protein
MDSVEVAYIKNNAIVNVLLFKASAPDEELEQFKISLEADSFVRLAYNESVKDGVISICEKPAPVSGIEYVWVQESKTWELPFGEFPTPVLSGEALAAELERELNQN